MGISDEIRARKHEITRRWQREVVREVPTLATLTPSALVDHLPEFIDGLAAWIDGEVTDAMRGFQRLVEGHALQRQTAGIDLEALTAEYATLRRVTLEILVEHASPAELASAIVRLADGLDRAIREAVHSYATQRDHVRERFIAILAHDLRDPLTAIMMSATLLADMTLGEKQAQLVERITRGSRRIERMIDDVLDFARGRLDGGIPIVPVQRPMDEICTAVVEEARAGAPGIAIQLETTGDLRGFWDPDRVAQALGNLLANARVYGQGEIVVRAWERDDHHAVLTSVTNPGPPIPAEVLARIFDPYARSPEVSRRGGLGLGLYIVEQIARAHGGWCRATSSVERGTTFTIEWPRTPLAETPDRPQA
jgi:signal transduction histidine kinase